MCMGKRDKMVFKVHHRMRFQLKPWIFGKVNGNLVGFHTAKMRNYFQPTIYIFTLAKFIAFCFSSFYSNVVGCVCFNFSLHFFLFAYPINDTMNDIS